MTLEQFEQLKSTLSEVGIYYEEGNSYADGGFIVGHWLEVKETFFDTDEITKEDEIYNAL